MPFVVPSLMKKMRVTAPYSLKETYVLSKEEYRQLKALKQKIYIEKKHNELLNAYLERAREIYAAVYAEGTCIVSMVDVENQLLECSNCLLLSQREPETIEIKLEQYVSGPTLQRLETEMTLVYQRYYELIHYEQQLRACIRQYVQAKYDALDLLS